MSAGKAREYDIDFGDLVEIEQHRYGSANEKYVYKVIGRLQSNTWVDVPVVSAEEETIHLHQMEEVVRCICCGVDETKVSRFRVSDVNILEHTKDEKKLQKENEALKAKLEKAKEGLRFYADEGNWTIDRDATDEANENLINAIHGFYTAILGDSDGFSMMGTHSYVGGTKARKALKDLEAGE